MLITIIVDNNGDDYGDCNADLDDEEEDDDDDDDDHDDCWSSWW